MRVEGMTAIRFLGTGGARFTVARQIRASGGMWMHFGSTQIHVDPGPGALVRALSVVPPCNPVELDAIVLSHKHLDHANDVNIMVEAMSQGGYRPRGTLFAPRDAFEGEPVILPTVRSSSSARCSSKSAPVRTRSTTSSCGLRSATFTASRPTGCISAIKGGRSRICLAGGSSTA